MCNTGATVITVTLKHKTRSATRAIRLKKGEHVFNKAGAASFVLDREGDDWEVKTVTESFDARWMS